MIEYIKFINLRNFPIQLEICNKLVIIGLNQSITCYENNYLGINLLDDSLNVKKLNNPTFLMYNTLFKNLYNLLSNIGNGLFDLESRTKKTIYTSAEFSALPGFADFDYRVEFKYTGDATVYCLVDLTYMPLLINEALYKIERTVFTV